MEEVHVSQSPSDTVRLGEAFAKRIKKGGILALYGDLGSGKTTFVQGLAKGLGVKKRIISPTFIIIRSYNNFYHVDLYRIEEGREIEELGLEEIFADPKNIVAIEWAEKIRKLLPKKRFDLRFTYIDDEKRRIVINGSSMGN